MGNTQKTLTIVNHFTNANIMVIVDASINCCDLPQPGNIISGIMANGGTGTLAYVKTSGHGCDGNQGQFTLDVYINSVSSGSQPFDFDSGGNIELSSDAPTNWINKLTGSDTGATWDILPV